MRITKLLALAAVAVAAVACNGISPTSPNATVASEDATALGDAKALNSPVNGSPCRDITEVQMQLLRSEEALYLKVQAVYLTRGLPTRCEVAPDWSSRPQRRLIPTKDPFIVKVTRTRPPTTVQVIAQAPNGVRGSIRVR